MEKQTLPIIYSLIAAVLGAGAQYFYKVGAKNIFEISLFKNWAIWMGLISFTLVLVLFIAAFRNGGRLFVIYPVYATTYIWGGLIAYHIEKESISNWQYVGVALIMLGVGVISVGHATD